MIELHAVIRGEVQGVGFRATTRHLAQQLGLKGTVRNLADGSVEIYAQGPRESLEQLLNKLDELFNLEAETGIKKEYSSISRSFKSFDIL